MPFKITPAGVSTAQLEKSRAIFKKNNPTVNDLISTLDRKMLKIRKDAIDVYERALQDLNIFDSTENNLPVYNDAVEALRKFVTEHVPSLKDRKTVYDSVIAEINPKKHAEIESFSGKMEVFPTPAKAKEVLDLGFELDTLEAKLERIKEEARKNGQTELNTKQKTRYNKVVREFNRKRAEHADAVHDYRIMKMLNQRIFAANGMGDFFRPYSVIPYKLSRGGKTAEYKAIPVSVISPNGNQIVELANDPNTRIAFNSNGNRILSFMHLDDKGRLKIEFCNADGDIVKISTFDPKTKKAKVRQVKK